MATRIQSRTTFEIEDSIQPIYTGGTVALDDRGRLLATCLGEDAVITDLRSGKLLARIEGVQSLPIFSIALDLSELAMLTAQSILVGRRGHHFLSSYVGHHSPWS
jgi:U3 small nucleolar RNA-associated protein 13